MMKGTPYSRGNYAPLKTSSKTRYGTRRTDPAKRVRAWALSGNDWPNPGGLLLVSNGDKQAMLPEIPSTRIVLLSAMVELPLVP